jgi:hypothetical protein
VNYDGDPIVITTVRFLAEEPERLAAALDGASALEREGADDEGEPRGGVRRWSWSGKGRDRKELVLFGSFELRDGILEVHTNSAERGERARKLVARVAGELARHQVTVTEDGEVQLVLNATLYATSLRSLPEPRPIDEEPGLRSKSIVVPSDEVYFLPGTIDIGSLAQLKQLRRVGRKRRSIMQRSMVRGHWRRAPEGWKDPRPRWIGGEATLFLGRGALPPVTRAAADQDPPQARARGGVGRRFLIVLGSDGSRALGPREGE